MGSRGHGRCLMTRARREFAAEFKREAVALMTGSGRPLTQIATELGIQPSMLRNWRAIENGRQPRLRSGQVAALPSTPGALLPSPPDLASENAKLRRELERTRMERDILKKMIGIFAEVPK